ncbi:MAG: hypothetical protein JXA82_04940 [Sedimentisphaerales bacterium]|nr:hypothetical protein [Sedimentisphaerales bacterium]
MDKMQIIARAALTGLGFYALGMIMRTAYEVSTYTSHPGMCLELIRLAICIIFVLFPVFFLCNVSRISQWLIGTGPVNHSYNHRLWFVASMRGAFLLAGLILLATSIRIVLDFGGLFLSLPVQSRQLFNEMIYSHNFLAALHMLLVGVIAILWHFAYIVLIFYLIIGAPHFLCRECQRFSKDLNFSAEETENE